MSSENAILVGAEGQDRVTFWVLSLSPPYWVSPGKALAIAVPLFPCS